MRSVRHYLRCTVVLLPQEIQFHDAGANGYYLPLLCRLHGCVCRGSVGREELRDVFEHSWDVGSVRAYFRLNISDRSVTEKTLAHVQ